jgi:hypothetical protein
MGYAFYVSKVAAYQSTVNATKAVDVSVQATQLGVAPFYYDLSLVLECGSGVFNTTLPGVDEIIAKCETKDFLFRNIPATVQYFKQISLSLQSSYAYIRRSVRFAQGYAGSGKVSFRVPFPSQKLCTSPSACLCTFPCATTNHCIEYCRRSTTISPVIRRFFPTNIP